MTVMWGIVQTDDGPVEVHSDDELIAAINKNSAIMEQWRKNVREAMQEYARTSPLLKYIQPAQDGDK